MKTSGNRILEVVTGYEQAVAEIAGAVRRWNESNGEGEERMKINRPSKLRADDMEGGSGEFFEAVCININTAENSAAEIYEIQTCW